MGVGVWVQGDGWSGAGDREVWPWNQAAAGHPRGRRRGGRWIQILGPGQDESLGKQALPHDAMFRHTLQTGNTDFKKKKSLMSQRESKRTGRSAMRVDGPQGDAAAWKILCPPALGSFDAGGSL